ncbi:MAG: GTP-binding protein [Thermoplasmata archaeon]|nr:GTP-binding protein [Thermoplasmata archaeon]
MTIEDEIRQIEEEIKNTKYNKKTQHHIGRLKAKLARLQNELEMRRSAGVGRSRQSYAVRKSGNATVALVGFPSVGKSTLLNKITDAESRVGAYDFTTLNIIPGMLVHKGAKIQILDMPGIVSGAAAGRGRGREVLSVARSADLIALVCDVFEHNVDALVSELYKGGIRLNQRPPNVSVTKKERGGIEVHSTVELTVLNELLVKDIVREMGYINADVVLREDLTEERLIDALSQNRVYIPAICILNKIDLIDEHTLENTVKAIQAGGFDVIPISSEREINLEILKEKIYSALEFIRIYMKPQGGDVDYREPLILRKGADVEDVCNAIHRDFKNRFRYACVWGKSARHPGQRVGLNHKLEDEDILTLILRSE